MTPHYEKEEFAKGVLCAGKLVTKELLVLKNQCDHQVNHLCQQQHQAHHNKLAQQQHQAHHSNNTHHSKLAQQQHQTHQQQHSSQETGPSQQQHPSQ